MYTEIIEKIDKQRRDRFLPIGVKSNGRTDIPGLPKGSAGMYFLYTSYTLDALQNAPALPGRAVPIGQLARSHGRLPHVCQLEQNGFRPVYNGIGGFNGGSYDLRTRLLQEISSTHPRTGSLCIRQSSVSDLSRWRFSYITLRCSDLDTAADFGAEWSYKAHAESLERCWRLAYGWPLLCRT